MKAITTKKSGIWMDHSMAYLIKFTIDPNEIKSIEAKFTNHEKEHGPGRNENLMHNKEQHLQTLYYKQLGDAIKDYDEVILFGPTDAKTELFNLLRADHRYENIKIGIKQTDKMTENQQHAFVREYFSKNSF